MKLLLQKYAMGSDWLAGSVCCDSLNRLYCTSKRPAPLLSGMCSGWIVNSGVVYNAYQFEPDWDPEDISAEQSMWAERGASAERSVRNIVGARSGFLSKGRSDRSVSLLFRSDTAHTMSLGHAQIHPEFTCAFNN